LVEGVDNSLSNRFAIASSTGLGSNTRLYITTTGDVTIPGFLTVGSTAVVTSAALNIDSTTGALLIPRMTTTQRDSLTAANGMMIYNTTAGKFQGREAGSWTNLI